MGPSGQQQQRATGLATASAVLGTLALLAVVVTFGVLFVVALPVGAAAAIMGVVARRRAGGGAATVGVVTGGLAVLLSLLVVALIAVVTIALDGIDLGGLPQAIRDLIPLNLERELDRQLPEVPDGVITE
ncbi:MAG: hypothetical protein M3481_00985 [Actinomycetota bacterium]|nr:hypothetical protein [Actinomycetota bacterium]